MHRNTRVRGASSFSRRPTPSLKLRVESLEERAVPANNLTIVAGSTDTNILIGPGNGSTITIFTRDGDAQLSIGTLQSQLQDTNRVNLIVTTDVKNGQPGSQAGTIIWDAATAGSLDFTGFGSGKTLTFETVAGNNATGHITLTGVQFQNGGSGDQISLNFDTSAINGNVTFQPAGAGAGAQTVGFSAAAVKDLMVASGTGAFSYTDSGTATPAEVAGAISISAASMTFDLIDGLVAGGPLSLTSAGAVTLASGTGLIAVGDLSITAGGAVSASNDALTADGGAVSISGTAVSLNNMAVTAPGGLTVAGTTSVTLSDGNYDMLGVVSITGGTIDLTNVVLPSTGDVALTGTSISLDTSVIGAGNGLTLTGPVTVQGTVDLQAGTNMAVTGTVDGTADLTLAAGGTLAFGQSIGAGTALTSLTLLRGTMELGTHNLEATQVTIGQVFSSDEATLGLNGALTGDVTVLATGNLAPGGLGSVGTMIVSGDVTFTEGDFAVDFGSTGADNLTTSGNVTIFGASQLGGGLGTGQLNSGLAIVIAAGGTVNGTFVNANTGVPVLVGTDVLNATYTTNQVIVTPYSPPGGAGPSAVGTDDDATGFKATLAGGGQLVTGTDYMGQLFLVARNTTAASKLTIATTANASDDLVTFPAGVLVSGPLASFKAPKVNIGSQFRASGAVTAATFRDFLDQPGATGIQFGGLPAQLTSITARNIFGSISTGSTLSSLKITQTLGVLGENSVVSAPSIKTVTARSANVSLTLPGRVTSVKTTEDFAGDVNAASVGTLSARSWSGDVTAVGAVDSVKTTGAFTGTIEAGSLVKFQSGGGFATLRTSGAIGSITGKGETGLGLELSASKIGAIKVDGALIGDAIADGPDWDISGGISSLTVGAIADLDVKATFLGAASVKGNAIYGLSGNILQSTFTLTGDDGTAAKLGLKSLTAKGNVIDSRFDVRAGNVGAVTVGRFHDSQLYLNYTPATSGDFTLGAFGTANFKLTSFKTTAIATTGSTHSLNWAFKGSEIVADSIGTITLSGLQTANPGAGFGIKVQKAGTTVLVMKADVTNDPDLPLGVNLTSDKIGPFTPLAGDFFYIQV